MLPVASGSGAAGVPKMVAGARLQAAGAHRAGVGRTNECAMSEPENQGGKFSKGSLLAIISWFLAILLLGWPTWGLLWLLWSMRDMKF
jgi:hypothetical protein